MFRVGFSFIYFKISSEWNQLNFFLIEKSRPMTGEMAKQLRVLTALLWGPRFSSLNSYGDSEPYVTPLPEDLILSSGFCGHQECRWYIDI